MKKIILAVLLLPLFSLAQTSTTVAETATVGGMKFEHGLSWKEIQAKAKAENKYIIMDCFTTWCGPCKFMDKTIFPMKESGDFFNANYINVQVQFDSTANDNADVKSWHDDMKKIEKEYGIAAYPTYLIFDPNGVAVHRAVGSTKDASEFIAKGKDGMVPETQYYTQLRKYENGNKTPDFLRKMALLAQSAYDLKNASKIANEYIATLTDLYTKENIDFISKFTSKSTDKGFAMMLENPEKVDAVIGQGKSRAKVLSIATNEEMTIGIRKVNADKAITVPDYSAVVESATQKYPQFANDFQTTATRYKISFLLGKKNWDAYKTEVVSYITKNGDKVTPAELNSYAWAVFENCKDMTCVTEALEWSKRSFADNPNPAFMDTYANILHKLGKTKEAIEIQEKAVALVTDDASKKTYQETLDKMKKGEKTWSDK